MRLLLDTHAFVWLVEGSPRLSSPIAAAIADPENAVLVSAVSAWEIALKVRLGKLSFDDAFLADFDNRIISFGFEPLPLRATHCVTGARLAGEHRDPFDRLLAGQAVVESLTVATRYPKLGQLGAKVLW